MPLLRTNFAFYLAALLLASTAQAQPSEKPPVRVTISKETTYITKPLREDGYPDYLRYLNEKMSQGVTRDNNAAVLYVRAFGPMDVTHGAHERFFQMLGIDPLPEDGKYFVGWLDFIRTVPDTALPVPRHKDETGRDALMEQLWTASQRPWQAAEFPQVERYLKANDRALATVTEASRKSQFYVPAVGTRSDSSLTDVFVAHLKKLRDATELLAARAMLNLHNGDSEVVWRDSVTIHRIANQHRGGTTLDHLLGIAFDSQAWQLDATLFRSPSLGSRLTRRILADLEEIPPQDDALLQTVRLERLAQLDVVCSVARTGPNTLAIIIDPPSFDFEKLFDDAPIPSPPKETLLTKLDEHQRRSLVAVIDGRCDWDVPLRTVNAALDQLEQALAEPDQATRRILLDKLVADAKHVQEQGRRLGWCSALFESQKQLSDRVAGLFVGMFIPAMKGLVAADERFRTQRRLIHLGAALAAHRAEKGDYPEKLAALVPGYMRQIPLDAFDQPFVYRRTSDGNTKDYVLYSLGENGEDDGAVNCRDDGRCTLDISFHPDWSRFPDPATAP